MDKDTNPEGYLSDQDFENVIRHAPLVSMDLIVRDNKGRVLLGRRINEPAKGRLFVVGGRIWKNETRETAFRRITEIELGVKIEIDQAQPIGTYDHIYDTNFFEKPGFGTHYVVLGYEVTLSQKTSLPKQQHDKYDWWTEEDILNSSDVHENTKAYFRQTIMRSESQYTALSTRRNISNTLLWQTPALSLTALAFLLNVAGNKNTYWEIRMVACGLAALISVVTLQLFLRHRKFEQEESKMLEKFELMNRQMGYAPMNRSHKEHVNYIFQMFGNLFDYLLGSFGRFFAKFKSTKWWSFLFMIFALASIYLLILNWRNRNGWPERDNLKPRTNVALDCAVQPGHSALTTPTPPAHNNEPMTGPSTQQQTTSDQVSAINNQTNPAPPPPTTNVSPPVLPPGSTIGTGNLVTVYEINPVLATNAQPVTPVSTK